MHLKLRIMVLLAGLGLVACATEPRVPTEIVLVRARIAALEDAGVENVANSPEEVDFASDSLVTLSIRQVLIGEVRDRKPVVVLRMSAWPAKPSRTEILVFYRVRPEGELDVIDWNYASKELCIDPELARTFNIEREVAQLYKRRQLECSLEMLE
jgi:hypothetical protein